ncbi:hypothetical protein KEM48_007499 [Puccinia striiformis f. sp. tritici PST-130]|nr:hypothetical protein KEM48_007499 [Puccinia striiformis f. sp. tritici PST-130]
MPAVQNSSRRMIYILFIGMITTLSITLPTLTHVGAISKRQKGDTRWTLTKPHAATVNMSGYANWRSALPTS